MKPRSSLPAEISKVLGRGGIILTGNQRAARTLKRGFEQEQRSQDLKHWQPPPIFAWETWAGNLWRQRLLEGTADRLLLNASQELYLWRSIIAADPHHTGLQKVDSLASMAAQAWKLLCAYRGQSRLGQLGVNYDTRTFQRWAQAFGRRCQTDRYLSNSELNAALASSPRSLPAVEFLLVGFDTLTPSQAALVDALRESGSKVSELTPSSQAEQRFLAASRTLESELLQAAHAIRAFLEAKPAARVAVIHPDIASERGEVERVFRHTLAPELEDVTNAAAGPFEFSLGLPLSQEPIAATALHILHLATRPLNISAISSLLLSPWFTPANEIAHRAELDAYVIRSSTMLHPQLGLDGLMRAARHQRYGDRLGNLLRQLHSLQSAVERIAPDSSTQKSFADWADGIREILRAAGWASFTAETSIEFQARQKWESALDELATLDFTGARSNFSDALGHLEGILDRTLFAPESRDAPVQIMSPQEAAGSEFDAIFFLRCSDLNWPPVVANSPLLGWRLQRELRMPGSDPALDMAHSTGVTRRLAASTPHIVFSYAQQTQDSHQHPSPLLADLDLQKKDELEIDLLPPVIALEEVDDSPNIPLGDAKVRGGSSVLKSQAACAFRAFAEARLASTPLRALVPGLDAGERGSLVHATMARLWDDLRSQAALRALTSDERRIQLDRAITHALERVARATGSAQSVWDNAYLAVQRDRLHRLLGPWLEKELQRAPFAVKSVEQKFDGVAFGPLQLDIRIDRIDTLLDEEGAPAGEILLDYKTGEAGPLQWQGDRPDDPQLPLYAAISYPGTLAAVGFVSLRPGKAMGLAGYADGDNVLLKQSSFEGDCLQNQIELWREVLLTLAESFAAGDASVDPKIFPTTCKHCAQRILCRVNPDLLASRHDEEDAEEDVTVGEGHG